MAQKPQTHTVYDAQGNPIQVHADQFQRAVVGTETAAQTGGTAPTPHVVFMTRPHEPVKPIMSEKAKARHLASLKAYPHLNLSEGEYVITAIERHPIGLVEIWAAVSVVLALLIGGMAVTLGGSDTDVTIINPESAPYLGLMFIALMALALIIGIVATVIYRGNKFFLTNESVIQHLQHGIFSRKEQTISLTNIEDASFTQHGILQHMFNYGLLRLSTEGDETTYRFPYAGSPSKLISVLNNAVEAFKNGRPVDPDGD